MNNPRSIHHSQFFENENLEDQIKFLLQYAILAPSTHNSQPWLFKIESNVCKIFYNHKLLIPIGDPTMRDLHMSIGCATENMYIAGQYFNMNPVVEMGPFEEESLLSKITFSFSNGNTNEQWKKLIDTILIRINARGIFDGEKLSEDMLNSIQSTLNEQGYFEKVHLHYVIDEYKRKELATLTSDGLKMAYQDPDFRKEMSSWMNNSLSPKRQGLHGYALKMPFLLSFIVPTMVKYKKDIGTFLAGKNYASVSSAPLINILTSPENNPKTWLHCGRLAERMFLEFNSQGVNTSVFVASVEMGDLYKQVQKIIGTDEIPQFLFVAGKVDSLHKFTPRYSVKEKIII